MDMNATLVVFKENGKRMEIPLKNGVTVIGRRPECDVRIPLGTVSRKHCKLVQKGDLLTVQDLGSANGTYINYKKVMEDVVRAGDILTVGNMTFTVQIDGKPEHIAPPQKPAAKEDAAPKARAAKNEDSSGVTSEMTDSELLGGESDALADLEPLADYGSLDDSSQH